MAKTLKVLVDIEVSDDGKHCSRYCKKLHYYTNMWCDDKYYCALLDKDIFHWTTGEFDRPRECFDKVKEAERKTNG